MFGISSEPVDFLAEIRFIANVKGLVEGAQDILKNIATEAATFDYETILAALGGDAQALAQLDGNMREVIEIAGEFLVDVIYIATDEENLNFKEVGR